MVLHDHQANPHVHIGVRAESRQGQRLNPRKTDLHRWRETFSEKLRGYGIEAEATRQATRGRSRNPIDLWRVKAQEDGRLQSRRPSRKGGAKASATRKEANEAGMHIGLALAGSDVPADIQLSRSIAMFVHEAPLNPARAAKEHAPEQPVGEKAFSVNVTRMR